MKKDTKEDVERQRAELRAFMKSHGLTVKGWSRKSGIVPGILRNFLLGSSSSLTSASLRALSRGAEASVTEMLPSLSGRSDVDSDAAVGSEMATGAAIEALLRELIEAQRKVEAQLALLVAQRLGLATEERPQEEDSATRDRPTARKPS